MLPDNDCAAVLAGQTVFQEYLTPGCPVSR